MSDSGERFRKACAYAALSGLGVFIPSFVVAIATRGRGPWGAVGMGLTFVSLFVSVGASLINLCTSRCPFCGKWVHPAYRPRPGVHCPRCGKTVEN